MTKVLEVMALTTGGIGRHVAELARSLNEDDVSVDVAAPAATKIPMPKPVIPLEIPRAAGLPLWRSVKSLERVLENHGYDVVHAHGLRAGLVALRAAGELPVVVTLHNLVRPETSGSFRSLMFRRGETAVLRGARRVFAVSEQMAVVLTERSPRHAGKIELLPIGLPEPSAHRSRAEVRRELRTGDRPLVVTVARLARQKALDVLLRAMVSVDAVLAIVGDGPLEAELRALAAELQIADRVHFLGWQEEVGDYLHAADVFALSSTWEARALAVQEAILAGVPVVSTAVGGMPELISDRHSGRLVPPNDPSLLAAAIDEILRSPDHARSYAERAKRALSSGYSPTEMLKQVKRSYLELAHG